MKTIEHFEQLIAAKVINTSAFVGMVGGSSTTLLAKASEAGIGGHLIGFISELGDPDFVAGVGVLAVVAGVVIKIFHNRAVRRIQAEDMRKQRHLKLAQMSPDEQKEYRRLEGEIE